MPTTLNGPASLGGFAPQANISGSYPATGGNPPLQLVDCRRACHRTHAERSTGALNGSITPPATTRSRSKPPTRRLPAPSSVSTSVCLCSAFPPPPLPNGTVNVAYTQTLNVIGGTPPYAWSVTVGTLPTGLTLSSSGVLTGTPTARHAAAGRRHVLVYGFGHQRRRHRFAGAHADDYAADSAAQNPRRRRRDPGHRHRRHGLDSLFADSAGR